MPLDASDKEKLNDIHRVLIGNEKMRQKGLIERVEKLEDKDKKAGWIVGIVTGVSLGIGYALTKVHELFK